MLSAQMAATVLPAAGVFAAEPQEESSSVAVSKELRATEKMDTVISNYKYLDFEEMAKVLDRVLFEFAQNPEYVEPDTDTLLPIGYWDDTHVNFDKRMFGIPSYIGQVDANGATTMLPGTQEGITTIMAVLNGELVGIDKTDQYGYDFVEMM